MNSSDNSSDCKVHQDNDFTVQNVIDSLENIESNIKRITRSQKKLISHVSIKSEENQASSDDHSDYRSESSTASCDKQQS